MGASVQQLQAAFDSITAAAQKVADADTAGVNALNTIGQLLRDNAGDEAAVRLIADGMTNTSGTLTSSADSIMAAVLANTPSQPA